MKPGARIQAAIEILEGLGTSAMPADRFIRDYFRKRRYAGSKDRAAVAERVFDVFRHRASFAWRMGSDSPRALVIASLLNEGAEVSSLFTGDGYGPAGLSDAERAALMAHPREPPAHISGEYPAFLHDELQRAFGADASREMDAMLKRAPIDLRVNTLKAHRDDVLAALRAEGFEANPARYSPAAIRCPAGARGLERTELFGQGAYEFQDEAAQVSVMLAQARRGMRVLDLAAGAGGKALALAAAMANSGEIVAHDIDPNRLNRIAPRASRAGVTIIESASRIAGRFDLVFVDAPCSGSGTWRRQPENKWRLTPERLEALNATQDSLLEEAAGTAAPRIVYATCSVLPCENEERVAAFLSRHKEYALLDAGRIWQQMQKGESLPARGPYFRATPRTTGTDGFFTAILAQRGPALASAPGSG